MGNYVKQRQGSNTLEVGDEIRDEFSNEAKSHYISSILNKNKEAKGVISINTRETKAVGCEELISFIRPMISFIDFFYFEIHSSERFDNLILTAPKYCSASILFCLISSYSFKVIYLKKLLSVVENGFSNGFFL